MRPHASLVSCGPDALPLSDMMPRAFTDWMRATHSPATNRQYFGRLLEVAAQYRLDEMTETDWVAWLKDRTVPMQRAYLSAAKCFYNYLEVPDPTRRIPMPKPNHREVPFFSKEQIATHQRALFAISERAGWAGMLTLATGCRVGSLVHVTTTDVDFLRRRIRFRVAKCGKPYSVPLSRRGLIAAAHLAAAAGGGELDRLVPVTTNCVERWFRKASEACGVDCSPHDYRHAAATFWAQKTDPRTWMALMNHASIALYGVYAGVDAERMREAVEAV